MSEVFDLPADVSFGSAGAPLPNWRADAHQLHDDSDPDDEELAETPADVLAILGFDPLDEDDDEPEVWRTPE